LPYLLSFSRRFSMNILKPPRLQKGDLIGIVSPASPPSAQEKIDKGVQYLERLGYRVKIGPHVMAQHGYLAGTDEERAHDFNDMVRDKQVKAIFAVRGGYGTPRLLHLIDYQSVRRNPKIVVGYSDLTALQLALFKRTGLVTFSGPMVGVEMWDGIDPFTEEHFWRAVTSSAPLGPLPHPPEVPFSFFNKGAVRGRMIGGNFALVMSLVGTPYLPELRRSLFVLEDVDEAPHRVDRMFMQLRYAGILKKIAGLILGRFTDCVPSDPSTPHLTVEEVLQETVESVRYPVLTNLAYGHVPRKLTLVFGVRTLLDARRKKLEVLEGAVS
jgi:muramoyltetrapeptide carboxypeptidase